MLNSITIKINNVKPSVKNIVFWFRRKSIPKIEDEGIADIELGGSGISCTIQIEARTEEGARVTFKITKITCEIDELNVYFVDSTYDWILNLISGYISNQIKKLATIEVESQIFRVASKLESTLNWVVRHMPNASEISIKPEVLHTFAKRLPEPILSTLGVFNCWY